MLATHKMRQQLSHNLLEFNTLAGLSNFRKPRIFVEVHIRLFHGSNLKCLNRQFGNKAAGI